MTMGREARRVPADWQHPRDERGDYIPLYGRSYKRDVERWDEERAQWDRGLVRDFCTDGWRERPAQYADMPFERWDGARPVESDYMPDWPESERTHWQMYEDTTEGTPISPVMESPEALARWLADNGASAFGSMTATYEQWLATIRRGSSMGAVFTPTAGLISGVEANAILGDGKDAA